MKITKEHEGKVVTNEEWNPLKVLKVDGDFFWGIFLLGGYQTFKCNDGWTVVEEKKLPSERIQYYAGNRVDGDLSKLVHAIICFLDEQEIKKC